MRSASTWKATATVINLPLTEATPLLSCTSGGGDKDVDKVARHVATDDDVDDDPIVEGGTDLTDGSKTAVAVMFGLFLAIIILFTVKAEAPSNLKKPPNIVFLLSDDQGYGSLKDEVTPFLRGLQTRGVNLVRYYAQEACAPSRMALLTGRYPLSVGMPDDELAASKEEGLPLDETTIAEVLQHSGYTTYMFGKWNLGNASPRYVPTARGFDYFLGFLNGYQFYWSKLIPGEGDTVYRDLSYSDQSCFYMYDATDMEHYSTHLYQDKAVQAIQLHDFHEKSMFLYVAFQAVHNPFADNQATFPSGIPDSYVNATVLGRIGETYSEQATLKQYFMAMAIMDSAVESIFKALEQREVMDNTYVIFASDNGGCPGGGGRNYPLRGTKGSLFEGGVRVEAFIFSPLLEVLGTGAYPHLFHVTDWFPTLLDMAGVKYKPATGYHLDGVSHFTALQTPAGGPDAPREYMLYNYYYDPADTSKNLWTGKAAAVRNARYKLIHTFDNKWSGAWYTEGEHYEADDDFTQVGGCSVTTAISSGTFTHFLFDLDNDPYEETNLYGLSDVYEAVQDELYAKLDEYTANARPGPQVTSNDLEYVIWEESYNYVVPWDSPEDVSTLIESKAAITYPNHCGLYSKSAASAAPFVNLNANNGYHRRRTAASETEQQRPRTRTRRMKGVS